MTFVLRQQQVQPRTVSVDGAPQLPATVAHQIVGANDHESQAVARDLRFAATIVNTTLLATVNA